MCVSNTLTTGSAASEKFVLEQVTQKAAIRCVCGEGRNDRRSDSRRDFSGVLFVLTKGWVYSVLTKESKYFADLPQGGLVIRLPRGGKYRATYYSRAGKLIFAYLILFADNIYSNKTR